MLKEISHRSLQNTHINTDSIRDMKEIFNSSNICLKGN